MPFEWGILPVPANAQQKNPVYPLWDTRVFVVPATAVVRLDSICQWLNGVAECNGELLKRTTLGWSEQATADYQRIMNQVAVEYGAQMISDSCVSQFDAIVTNSCRCDPRKVYSSVHEVHQQELDAFWEPLYNK